MIFETIHQMENLQAAWERVRANRPAPGIDRVKWEDFERNLAWNLQTLQNQVRDETYKPLPVSVFNDRRTPGKNRMIGVSTIRDRVVQHAVLKAISPIFERRFLPCCFAYRPGFSALAAVRKAAECIASGNLWILQMDVEKFFDTMDHAILLDLIGRAIGDKPVIRLISRLLKARIFREMGLFDNLAGTQQGSGLSPLLSNIYLHPLDTLLWEKYKNRYLRYSDDLAVFSDEKEKLDEAGTLIERCLCELKLAPNRAKTFISHVGSGVTYLGYYLDAGGKGPSSKSIESLQSRLAEYDKLRRTDDIPQRLADLSAILRGWCNYYGTIKPVKPANILSLIAIVEVADSVGETVHARELLGGSAGHSHNHPEISFRLGELWMRFGRSNQAMREYARALELDPGMAKAADRVRSIQESETNVHGAIEKVQLLLHRNPYYREGYRKLAEYYSELGLFGFAEKAHEKALEIDDDSEDPTEAALPGAAEQLPRDAFDFRAVDTELFLQTFAGRKDAYARQWVDERGRWGFVRIERPLRSRDIYSHLKGDQTLAVYPVTAVDTVNFIVFDVDTARRVILESGADQLDAFRKKTHEDVVRIGTVCARLGLSLCIEDSGYKGRHGWLLFDSEVPATRAIMLGRKIMDEAGGPSEGIVWELFPMGKSRRHLSAIKLPLGINRKNNRRCLFLDEKGLPVADQAAFVRDLKRNPAADVMALLGKDADSSPVPGAPTRPGADEKNGGQPGNGIGRMLSRCKVLAHLVSKARDTNYLTHYERTCLLYTLTFAGEEGNAFLHKVISHCINYNRQVTQQHIDRRKESPISCARIMENFPELAEALPCDCSFQIPPGGYPSPVLYLVEAEIEKTGAGIFPAQAPEKHADENKVPPSHGEKSEGALLDFAKIFSDESCGEGPSDPIERPSAGSEAGASDPSGSGEGMGTKAPLAADRDETDGAAIPGREAPESGKSAVPRAQTADSRHGATYTAPDRQGSRVEKEATRLAMELLRLTLNRVEIDRELDAVGHGLDALLDAEGADELPTGLGAVKRLRNEGKNSRWVLTIDTAGVKRGGRD